MSPPIHFEELAVGMSWRTPGATVTEDSIVRFSLEWDFQKFHVDRTLAEDSIFGGLVASGLHGLCLAYRLFNEISPLRGTALAGTGLENLRWLAPVRPGDTIHSQVSVAELLPHKRPDRGRLRLRFDTYNQDGDRLMQFDLLSIVRRRSAVGRQG